jgi:hypothetical protein
MLYCSFRLSYLIERKLVRWLDVIVETRVYRRSSAEGWMVDEDVAAAGITSPFAAGPAGVSSGADEGMAVGVKDEIGVGTLRFAMEEGAMKEEAVQSSGGGSKTE